VGAAAWLGVRATGAVGACPLAGVARTHACMLRWCGGAVKGLGIGWKKEDRERKTPGSTGQQDKERWRGAGLTWAAVLGKDGPAWFAWQTGLDS
jgi:hypothetical protein